MFKKLLTILLILNFLAPSLSFAADENAGVPESVPVYLYLSSNPPSLLATTLVDEEVFVFVILPLTDEEYTALSAYEYIGTFTESAESVRQRVMVGRH